MKKNINRVLSIALLSIALMTGAQQQAKAQDITVSYQTFYDNLSPYGQWIYDPEYGNVWVPNEDGDFRPYGSRGHWVMTDYGNTWVSEDPWGWAVYHYGRWTYNPYYGWVWVPGYEWAPAWVSWRYGGGYAGWAPLAPGISIGVSYYAPDSWWVFMGPQYMYQPNCIRYWYGPSYNANYIHHTTIINNYYMDNNTRVRYNYGPRAEVIQRETGQPVQVYRVSQLNRPGASSVGRGTVSFYRPNVDRSTVNQARPGTVIQAPRSVGRGQAVQEMGSGRQPAFRQDVQRLQPETRGNGRGQNEQRTGNQPGRQDMRTQPDRTDSRTQPGRQDPRVQPDRNDNRPQPGRFDDRRNENPQPGRQDPRTQPDRNDNRPQPGRFDDRRNENPQPGRQDPRPQPGRFDDRRNENPQPERQDPRPQPDRNDNRPQPGRFDDRRNENPQPSRQEPRPQEQPRRYDDRPQPGRFDDRRNENPQPSRQEPRPQEQPRRYDNRMDNRPQQPQPQRPPEMRRPDMPRPQQPQQQQPAQNNDGRPHGGGRR